MHIGKLFFGFICGVLIFLPGRPAFSQAASSAAQQVTEYARQAQTYLTERKPELAIPEFRKIVALDPENLDARANLGVLLFFQGSYADAIPQLRVALKLQPDLWKIQALLGLAEKRTGDVVNARRDLEAAFPSLHEEKLKVQIGLELTELDSASGDLDKAASILTELQRENPENVEIIYAAYRTYSDLADQSMLTLSLVAPYSSQMHQVMGQEEARQGNTDGAIEQYRKAIAIDTKLPGAHFELAELLNMSNDQKNKEEAAEEYLEALKQNPFDVKARCRLGDIYAQRGNLAQSYAYFSKAVALQPADADANFGLAKVLISMNQQQKALPILERAVQLEPTNASAHYRLFLLYRQAHRSADAKRELADYLKYKQMKEKLRDIYKQMRIQTTATSAEEEQEEK